MAFKIGNIENKNSYRMTVLGDAKDVAVHVADEATKGQETSVQGVMNSAGKTASKIISSTGDILSAPAVWLNNIQQNWLSYMVVVAIIFGSAAFFYCAFSIYCHRKKNNKIQSQFIELGRILGNKTINSSQSLALPAKSPPTISSLVDNSPV